MWRGFSEVKNVTFGAISLQVVTQIINVAWNHSECKKSIQHQKTMGQRLNLRNSK